MEVNTNKSQWIELHTTLFGGHQSIQCPRESGTTRISESREAKLNTNPTHGLKRFCSNKSTAKSRCHKNNLDINFLGSDSNEWPTTPPQRSDTVKIDGVWFTIVPQTTDMVQGMRWHRKIDGVWFTTVSQSWPNNYCCTPCVLPPQGSMHEKHPRYRHITLGKLPTRLTDYCGGERDRAPYQSMKSKRPKNNRWKNEEEHNKPQLDMRPPILVVRRGAVHRKSLCTRNR